jgi:hypothetical protein
LSRFELVKRLALEMAVTEEMERRSFVKLASVTAPTAERESEIARIADNMFLPAGITDQLALLVQKNRAR